MKKYKKWWLAACFISLTGVLMAAIIIPSSIASRNALTTLARDIMINISSYTLDKSENYLRPAEKAAELTRFLADSNIVSSNNPESMISYFFQQLALYRQFSGIYYGTTKGEFFMASRSNEKVKDGLFTKIIKIADGQRTVKLIWSAPNREVIDTKFNPEDKFDPRKRPWFIDALMNNDVVWTAPYLFFTSKKPGISTASPVYDRNGVLQGVVGVDISIEELSTFLGRLTIGENGKAFIVNSSGDVVAFPDLNELRKTSETNHKIRLSKINELSDPVCRKAFESLNLPPDRLPLEPVFTTFEHDDARYSAMFTPFKDPQWPWIIGIYIPENDYLGKIKKVRNINIAMASLAIFITGLIGWTVARKLDAAKEEAIAANETKSRFLAAMSHEIRTPMNVILGATDLLKNAGPREDQKEYINLLDNAGNGLIDLVNDILDMSKVEAGLLDLENITFNPAETIQQACSIFELSTAKKGIKLDYRIDEKFPEQVKGDPVRVKQILLNLIGNAVKFTSVGGINVSAGIESETDDKITLKFEIRDTGPGIPKEQLDTIFENYTQVVNSRNRENNGSGLGLAISRTLCHMMDGKISVTSSLGRGSAFHFTITLLKDDSKPCSTENNNEPCHEPLEPRKVLLVEDNKSSRTLFTHFMADSPHIIKCASNGEEAIETYKEFKPDIVFMDIEMPVMDGLKATEEIRDWERILGLNPVPVIALSAHALKGTEEAVFKAGCTGYMTKPVTKLQLLDKIERDSFPQV